jgi:hypothetical protein
MLNTRNEAGKGAFTPSKFKPTLRLARFVRATLAPLVLGLPPLFWVALAYARASRTALGRDQGIFQYIAWAIEKGAVDYRDVRDVNGPLVHWIHVAFLALGGADDHRLRVVDLAVTGATFAFVGACLPGLWSRGSPSLLERAAWAVAGCVVLSGQYLLYGFWDLAQRESFFDWFMLPSVALQLVAQAPRKGANAPRREAQLLVVVGALSVAPWFGKPTYALFTIGQLGALIADREQPLSRWRSVLAVGLGGLLAAVVELCILARHGDLIAYLRIQIADVPAMYRFIWPRSAADLMSLPRIATPATLGLVGAATFSALALMREMPARILAIAIVPVCALGSIVVQAKGFPYHLHPLTAGVHLQGLAFAAWITERSRVASRKRAFLRLVPIVVSASFAFSVAMAMQQSPHLHADFLLWRWSEEQRQSRAYLEHFTEPDFFPYEMRETAQYLREHTGADDRVQTYGMDPYLLFLAERLSATPYIYAYDLNVDAALAGGSGGRPSATQAAAIAAIQAAHEADLRARLEARPPAAFVFFDEAPTLSQTDAWDDFDRHCAKAAAWVRSRYRETARFGHDHVWLRRDLAEALPRYDSDGRPPT